ncbi:MULTISPECIES: ComF family protein [unclassified Novosphingobium]|uniref:ComF family protein n=1 Tax=unclassified Novosphingobium TaxID=2644732 RepID=UPI0025D6889A|nr:MULTISPECIES: ComF family protein [unclassified Novosphingobium]HQV02785.1 ComF family protein [Novosphingobium sp.]
MQLHPLLVPVADLLFPPRCPLCGEGLAAQSGLCAACWSELAIPGEPSCPTCQRPLGDGMAAGTVCAPCLADPPRHDGIAAGTLYNDASRKLILALKHGHRIALAPLLARLMLAQLPEEIGPGWAVVPVPLHRWRLWRRGFNQAALLAVELARARGAELLVDGLVRRKQTPTLGGLGKAARARALSGAIALNPRREAAIRGARIVLVDDVLTSGATTSACVSALKRGGAKQVRIACFARVLDEALDLV